MNDMTKTINGQEYISVTGIILLAVIAQSEAESTQHATDMINGFVQAAKDNGYRLQ